MVAASIERCGRGREILDGRMEIQRRVDNTSVVAMY